MSCGKWEIQILRWHQGELDEKHEQGLMRHLEGCAHCRSLDSRFQQLDRFLMEPDQPSVPPFLQQRIVASVTEEMREDHARGTAPRSVPLFASLRNAFAVAALLAAVGAGIFLGLHMARSVNATFVTGPHDLISLSGIDGGESESPFDFVWSEGGRRTSR